jgi:hypothetical protein
VQSNQLKKLQEFVDVGRLERVTYDAEFFSQQIESCSQSRVDALSLLEHHSLQNAFTLSYAFARKAANLLLYLRGVRPTARGGHRIIFEALHIDSQIPEALAMAYNELRVKRNTVEYPDIYTEQINLASIHRCIEIGDQLLAIAQSVSS